MLEVTKEYLDQMDSSMNDKELMLNYIVGNTVMDMGCGVGSLIRLISRKFPTMNIIGLDNNSDYINKANGYWYQKRAIPLHYDDPKIPQFIHGDLTTIRGKVAVGEVDTFIFSSVLHELYSYNRFNHAIVESVLAKAIMLLPVGGRLIIRDGVMPETNEERLIKFADPVDKELVFKYIKEFKGRKIQAYETSDDCVSMNEADAMEFLYTYTWGEEHYEREVQEQYGLFSPKDYINFVFSCADFAKCNLKLVTYNHYLQEGYNYYLSKRLSYMNTNGVKVRLPDSNGLFIFEKR